MHSYTDEYMTRIPAKVYVPWLPKEMNAMNAHHQKTRALTTSAMSPVGDIRKVSRLSGDKSV